MIWDFATGQEYVRIEAVKDDEVVYLVAEISLKCPDAEYTADMICRAHNREIGK